MKPPHKTDAELIAEAIAEGRVTKCPPMNCALSPDAMTTMRERTRIIRKNFHRGQRLRAAEERANET